MSNFLAVATVTEALRLFLSRNLVPDFPIEVQVQARKPPVEPPTDPAAVVTVFCYQVTPNPSQRNRDAPTRGPGGALLTRPRAALDLHYLISCYGEETQLVPQRLVGSVIRALYEEPVLSRADISAAAAQPFLAGSDLAEAVDRVRFTPTHIDIDDLYKLWTMMSQTPFALSVTYQASVVFIDGRATPAAGKPVLRRTVTVLPSGRPLVERLLSMPLAGPPGAVPVEGPVPRDHALVVQGSGLAADTVWARIAGTDIPVPADRVRDDRLVVHLPDTLPPGVYPLRVVQDVRTEAGTTLVKVLDSNVLPFVRQARLTAATVTAGPVLEVRLDLPIRDDQRVELLLDELDAPPDRGPHAYQLDAPFPLGARPDPQTVWVAIAGVAPAQYLARVRVDGAQSPLEQAPDGTFTGPVADLTGTA